MRAWQAEMLVAAIARDHSRFERLYGEHIKNPDDLMRMLDHVAEVFDMSEEDMCDAIEDFLRRFLARRH